MQECLDCPWYWKDVEEDAFPTCHCDGEAPCEEEVEYVPDDYYGD